MSLPIDPAKSAGVHRPMFGVPYVGWSPRPAKNGQPNTCTTCIPARKFGGLARRIPLIWAGPKTKEQILEKWDPISKRLVKVKCECVVVPVAVPAPPVTPTYSSFFYINESSPSFDEFTTSVLVELTGINAGKLLSVYLTQTGIGGVSLPTLTAGQTGTLKIQKAGAPDIITTYTVFGVFGSLAYSLTLPTPKQDMPSEYSSGDIVTLTLS